MDIWVTFHAFQRIVEKGEYSGLIFESKGTVVTTVGSSTVLATKPKPIKYFPNALPFVRSGYRIIATEKEEPADVDTCIQMILDLATYLDKNEVQTLIAKLKESIKGA